MYLSSPCPPLHGKKYYQVYANTHANQFVHVSSKMAAVWTKFCGASGKRHDDNTIECSDCKATNPRARVEVVDISDDENTQPQHNTQPQPAAQAISAYNNRALHPSYRSTDKKRPKQSRLTTARRQVEPATGSDKVYQTIVNFHLTHYDIMDGIIQYTRTRIIGML
jgi:hypothetical protein